MHFAVWPRNGNVYMPERNVRYEIATEKKAAEQKWLQRKWLHENG